MLRFIGKFRGGMPQKIDDLKDVQWFKPIESRNIPTSRSN